MIQITQEKPQKLTHHFQMFSFKFQMFENVQKHEAIYEPHKE